MSFDFGFALHFLDGPELNAVETFFVQFQYKLQMYRRNHEMTVKLYKDEFREQMEAHIAKRKAAVHKAEASYKQYFDEIQGSDDEKHAYAMHESGLDELEYYMDNEEEELKKTFAEMADHFSKSSLVTLYALLEAELRRLCVKLQIAFKKKVTLERFEKDDYLKSIIEYMDSIIEIDTQSLKPYISKISEIQFLRNKIMHNGGEFKMEKNVYLEDLLKANTGMLRLEEIPEEDVRVIRINSKYLAPFYDLISRFVLEILIEIDKKKEFAFTIGRLTFIFRFLGSDVSAVYIDDKSVKNGHQFTVRVTSAKSQFRFLCKLTITKATKEEIIITNQLESEIPYLQRLIDRLPENFDFLSQIFKGFLQQGENYRFEFILYPDE